MKYLLIDTDVYIQCSLLENEGDDKKAIETLLKLLDEDKIKLLLPEVVKLEFYKVLRKKLNSLKKTIGLIGKEAFEKKDIDEKIKKDLVNALKKVIQRREKNIEEVKVLLDKVFKHRNTVFLEIKESAILNTFKMYLSGEKPYSTDPIKGVLQADCLIVEAARDFLSKETNYDLYICSRNKADFSENPDNKEESYVIAQDIKKKFVKAEYTPNLFKLLNEKFGSKFGEKLLKKISKEISENKLTFKPIAEGSYISPNTVGYWSIPNGTVVPEYSIVEPIDTSGTSISTRSLNCSNCGKRFFYYDPSIMSMGATALNKRVYCTQCGQLNII